LADFIVTDEYGKSYAVYDVETHEQAIEKLLKEHTEEVLDRELEVCYN
jgi:hypothetical protein